MRMYDYHGPTGVIRQAVITLIGREGCAGIRGYLLITLLLSGLYREQRGKSMGGHLC